MRKLIIVAIIAMIAPMSAMAQKFGHFNSTELVQIMPEYKAAQSELENLAQQYEADLKRMQDELQKKGEDFEREQANLLDNVRQRRQQELQDLYTRMQQSVQDNQQAFQRAQQEKMQGISDKVTAAVKQVGEAGGFVYIMDVSMGIPYISNSLSTDVTPEIKKALGL